MKEKLIQELLKFANENPESLGVPEKGRSIVPRLENLGEQMGLDEKEKELLIILNFLSVSFSPITVEKQEPIENKTD